MKHRWRRRDGSIVCKRKVVRWIYIYIYMENAGRKRKKQKRKSNRGIGDRKKRDLFEEEEEKKEVEDMVAGRIKVGRNRTMGVC